MIVRPMLYVEDHADSVALVETLLAGRKDLQLLHAADAKLAIKLARQQRPEVILINVELAGMSALEFIKVLRADQATQTTPILALSANQAPEAVLTALEAGFFQVLSKPLQAAPFLKALDFALEFAAVERSEYNPLKESRMKIRPLHDRVIVKRLDEEKKTASGIVIPDSAAEKPDQGEVTAVGKGKITDDGKLVPIDLKVGDRVLFGKYAGQTVRVKGDELLVMREDDIMGVVEGRP